MPQHNLGKQSLSRSCSFDPCFLNSDVCSSQPDKKYAYVNVHSTFDGKWHGVIATLDTGSDENWISQEVVDRLRLDVTNGLVTKWRSFNGANVASDSTVRATWSNLGTGVSYANIFRIIPDPPFDILFGRNLIVSGEVSWTDNSKVSSVLIHEQPPIFPAEKREIHDRQGTNDASSSAAARSYRLVLQGTDPAQGFSPGYNLNSSQPATNRTAPRPNSGGGQPGGWCCTVSIALR